MNNAWFLLKPAKMDKKINKNKVNEGDIIKIGRITIRIKEIKLDWNNKDYFYLNIKNGNNISNNSIKIIGSNNNSGIINENVEGTSNKNYIKNNNKIDSLRTTNQTMVPTNKTNKLIIKQNKIIENNTNDVDIVQKCDGNNDENEEKENNNDDNNNEDNNSEFDQERNNNKSSVCRICYMESPYRPLHMRRVHEIYSHEMFTALD